MVSTGWNIFRFIADASHASSKCILIWAIFANKSAEGVSLITQVLYLVVFCARYLPFQYWDTFSNRFVSSGHKIWNITLMTFYILSSAYIIWLMMRVYARTREREKAWKMGIYSSVASVALAPLVMMLFNSRDYWTITEFFWTSSEILESVCVLPQLLLLRQTTVPTVLDSYYLATLGAYRGFYILNWIVRGFTEQRRTDPGGPYKGDYWVSFVFGIIQTAMYVDFAWVYMTRQRVKLRGGAIVDSDDYNQGWLVKRIIGARRTGGEGGGFNDEEDPALAPEGEGEHASATPVSRSWGPRGISVSADEDLPESERRPASRQERLADPEHFEDDSSDDDTPVPTRPNGEVSGAATNGSEWRTEQMK